MIHDHHNHCSHVFKYCERCDVIYCTKCSKEWKDQPINWVYPIYYPYGPCTSPWWVSSGLLKNTPEIPFTSFEGSTSEHSHGTT